ncbi:MAG: extensin family protein, partial [Pacificimonas sp.]
LEEMTANYAPSDVRLSCPLAAALAIWETQVVQPAAERTLGSPVARVEHFGTYNCRRMYGATEGRWSRHATAEAIDIAGFRLEDGRQVSLLNDWGNDSDAGAFLEEIRTRGCDVFGTVLGPDYNAAHRDHFHLTSTGFGTCR